MTFQFSYRSFFPGYLVMLGAFLSACNVHEGTPMHDEPQYQVGAVDVEQLLESLTLEQKVAQMIQGEIKHVTPEDMRIYGLGSVLNGGGSFPNDEKYASTQAWVDLADAYYKASIQVSKDNAGIPTIWGTDAVHGHNNVVGATLFPHNIGLGAANDPKLIGRIGAATAVEVKATGIDWIFAPTLAVAIDDRWGRTYEAYSDRPSIVSDYAYEVVAAIQGQGMAATAKHFIGDGGTYRGVDQGDTQLPLETLLEIHGQGYYKALDAGVLSVMASFNSWNGDKIHGNKELLTDVLKGRLGFEGFVVSDWNGVGQVDGCTSDSCAQAINAGIDMIMAPEDWKALLFNTVQQVKDGEISMARIDDAVRRILLVKNEIGLFDGVMPSTRAQNLTNEIGSDAHRNIAREAVRKSLVMLKNNSNVLPVKASSKILVAGSGADSIQMQTGGWTLSWQGTGNSNDDFPGATSIYAGIQEVVTAAGGNAELAVSANYEVRPDVAIVVFGESPYAEGQGDVGSLSWQQGYDRDLTVLQRLQADGIPVVSVLLTGRPLWVNQHINASDAFVVAWLPGSEGNGVADILLAGADGTSKYDFTGRLSFDWPNSDLNNVDAHLPVADILFPYGYGLDYQNSSNLSAELQEEPLGEIVGLDRTIFSGGSKEPWQLFIGDAENWSVPVTGGSAVTDKGGLALSSIDRFVQEDARLLQWSGEGEDPSQVYWQSDSPVDFTDLRALDGVLSVIYQVAQAPTSTVTMRMDCGFPCTGELNVTDIFSQESGAGWQQIAIPLACFEAAGADLGKVVTPLVISSAAKFGLKIAGVSVLEDAPNDALLVCPE